MRLTDQEFWDAEPRFIFAMAGEWEEITKYNAALIGLASNGQELPKRTPKRTKEKEQAFFVNPFFF